MFAGQRGRLHTEASPRRLTGCPYRLSQWVALYRAADLRDKGLGIVPSGVAPHYDASVGDVYGQDFGSVQITASSAEDLIDRFITATYTGRQNEHFTPRPS